MCPNAHEGGVCLPVVLVETHRPLTVAGIGMCHIALRYRRIEGYCRCIVLHSIVPTQQRNEMYTPYGPSRHVYETPQERIPLSALMVSSYPTCWETYLNSFHIVLIHIF